MWFGSSHHPRHDRRSRNERARDRYRYGGLYGPRPDRYHKVRPLPRYHGNPHGNHHRGSHGHYGGANPLGCSLAAVPPLALAACATAAAAALLAKNPAGR